MSFTGISIGPIIKTFGMARKPREAWAASYLFSHLMKCIYEEAKKMKGENTEIISPADPAEVLKEKENYKVGIYPDRLYVRGDFDVETVLNNSYHTFLSSLYNDDWKLIDLSYFNLMSATCEAIKDSNAIKILNQKLDVVELCQFANIGNHFSEVGKKPPRSVVELCQFANIGNPSVSIYSFISDWKKSPLFKKVEDKNRSFPYTVNTLAEIATAELRMIDENSWDDASKYAKKKEKENEANKKKEDIKDLPFEDYFYKSLGEKKSFEGKIKSHHRYICVVQADGDNVGKTVSHDKLKDENLKKISEALVNFGNESAGMILEYGGLPIYAGGDDLLFIAPVIGKDHQNIFDLLDNIENEAFKGVHDAVDELKDCTDDNGKKIEASLSFGVSITYYKYPLYEALESARHLLFDIAKKNRDKKAIAWSFRKHSGGTFDVSFTRKNDAKTDKAEKAKESEKNPLSEIFKELISVSKDNDMVSAVAHKVRQEDTLVGIVLDSYDENHKERLDSLFENILGFDASKNAYFQVVKELMPILYKAVGKAKFSEALYSILRTAKFIYGEELRDE